MSKFKAGDKVKIVSIGGDTSDPEHYRDYIGKVVTVTDVMGDDYELPIPTPNELSDNSYWSEDELEAAV